MSDPLMRGQGRTHHQIIEAIAVHVHGLEACPEVFPQLGASQCLLDGDGLLVLVVGAVQGEVFNYVHLSCASGMTCSGSSNNKLTSPAPRIKVA